jgi:hypothetical protein
MKLTICVDIQFIAQIQIYRFFHKLPAFIRDSVGPR